MQKGAEVIEMIKAPFKRKSTSNIIISSGGSYVGGATAASQSSPKLTPIRIRGSSVPRSISLGSSVNSLELENSCDLTNIYSEIDVNRVLLCDKQSNNQNLTINNKIKLLDDNDTVEGNTTGDDPDENEDTQTNGSKNNLLKFDNGSSSKGVTVANSCSSSSNIAGVDNIDDDMWSSVNMHLDNIDKVNKSLDEKIFNASKQMNNETIETEYRNSFCEIIRNTFSKENSTEKERLIIDDDELEIKSSPAINQETQLNETTLQSTNLQPSLV